MWVDDNGLQIDYELNSSTRFIAMVYRIMERVSWEAPAVLHWRWATHGEMNEKNTHPHRLSPNWAFCHNGILSQTVSKKRSDTVMFAKTFLGPITDQLKPLLKNDKWIESLGHLIGTNKLTFLNKDGEYYIVNEALGTWSATYNCWFSNNRYRKDYVKKKKVSSTPYLWNQYEPVVKVQPSPTEAELDKQLLERAKNFKKEVVPLAPSPYIGFNGSRFEPEPNPLDDSEEVIKYEEQLLDPTPWKSHEAFQEVEEEQCNTLHSCWLCIDYQETRTQHLTGWWLDETVFGYGYDFVCHDHAEEAYEEACLIEYSLEDDDDEDQHLPNPNQHDPNNKQQLTFMEEDDE
ncbi:MAG: hypothetical protein CL489_07975 [Acidobacteria bacterium]|nr:hypothetical protein [Acidobacteriota bacterium]